MTSQWNRHLQYRDQNTRQQSVKDLDTGSGMPRKIKSFEVLTTV